MLNLHYFLFMFYISFLTAKDIQIAVNLKHFCVFSSFC